MQGGGSLLFACYNSINMHQYTKTILVVVVVIVSLFMFLYFFGGSLINKFSPETEITSLVSENTTLKVSLNNKAPYFNLLSTSGNKMSLPDLAGSGTILTFWSTWNTDAVDQIKILDDYLLKNSSVKNKLPINIVTINSQEALSVTENFVRRGGYDVQVLVDSTGEVSNNYGIQTLPTTFFIDADGFVLEIYVGTLSEKMIVDKIERILP